MTKDVDLQMSGTVRLPWGHFMTAFAQIQKHHLQIETASYPSFGILIA